MLPGMNPRQMQQAMRKMGIQQTDIDATEVIIRTKEEEFVFNAPSVAKVNMMGQVSWQIVGEPLKRALSTEQEISEEDIATVMETANVDHTKALAAIKKHNGNLAEAIVSLQE